MTDEAGSNKNKAHGISPRGDETKRYDCGHEGPAKWDFVLFGHTHKINDEMVADSGKCGQCHLDEVIPEITSCAKCGVTISPGRNCIQYGEDHDKVYCLSTTCGPGPIAGRPGVWDKRQFVDGVLVGTIRLAR